MKNKNLSFTLSIILLCSEIFLASIIILSIYKPFKSLILENLLHKISYHSGEIINPIKNSMDETTCLIDNLSITLESDYIVKNQEKYANLLFKVKPGVVALRFVIFNPKDPKQIITDQFFYKDDDFVKTEKEAFYQDFPLAVNWMNISGKDSSQWSSPFYAKEKKNGFKQILIYSRPVEFISRGLKSKGIIYCAISLDKEMKSLSELNIFGSGFPVLITDKGQIIYPPDEQKSLTQNDNLSNLINTLDYHKILRESEEGTKIIYPELLNREKTLVLYWPVRSLNWVMFAVLPVSEYMSPLNKMLAAAILIILLVGGLSSALAIYLGRRLVSPISSLADASRNIIEEEGIKSSHLLSEVDILTQSIELMKRKLKNYEKEKLKSEMDSDEMDKELKLAREIEMGIVPTKFPLFPGRGDFDCYGRLLPAKIVGGDLFDFFLLDEDHLFVSICDTLGKGIPAAMFAVATRTLIRSIANPITRLGKIMELLNDELTVSHESDMYVTVMMGRLDLTNGEFSYCNAGHPRPFILKNNNRIEELEATHGFPVGVRKKQKYIETIITLKPGESIFAYTDGITEENNRHGNFYGKEKLYAVVQSNSSASPEKIIKEVLKSLDKFRGKKEIFDDSTMIAIKYIGKEI